MLIARSDIFEALEQQVRRLEGWGVQAPSERVSTSCAELNQLLPEKGFRRGSLIELLADPGSGAASLTLVLAREACRQQGALVVIDSKRRFYPPAASALGVDLARMVLVCPKTQKDQLWALHQTLCCPGVAAVVCWPEKLDDRAFRRIQLAAERGGTLGFLLRPKTVRGQPSWSQVQWLVTALPFKALSSRSSHSSAGMRAAPPPETVNTKRRLRIEVLRSRGGHGGATVELEFDDEQGTIQKIDTARHLHLAASLAAGTIGRRSSRA